MAIKKPEEKELEETNNGRSKEIPVDNHEEETQTHIVDFQEEDLASEYASKQTKASEDKGNGINPNASAEDLQKGIADYEASKSGKLEYKDFYKISEFIITMLDTTVSSALNWFAKDTASSAYSLPASNKKLLTEQLALVLAKYQTKFSIEFTFFMGLILLYAPSFLAAFSRRKENKKITKTRRDEKKVDQSHYRHIPEDDLPVEDNNENVKEEKKKDKILEREPRVPLKRQKGKQPKAF